MNQLLLGVVFTNPALWAGGLALGIPLLIHLFTKKALQILRFPTIRFLKVARASQSRVFKLRHFLLLLLRTALIALVLLAFLKPVIQQQTLAAPVDNHQRTVAIILLDASLSMAYSGTGVSPFSRGKIVAEKIVDDLRDDDQANLILVAATPQASFVEPTASKYPLRHDIENASPTLERAEVDTAIAEAVRQLGKLSGVRKEIHFISDFQRDNWAAAKFATIPKEVKTAFLSVADPEAWNLAIPEVVIQPTGPAVHEDVQVVCKVANNSTQPRQTPLHLKFGDETDLTHDLAIPAQTTVSSSFRLRANRSGVFEGELSIPDDNLAADNHRYFTLNVSDRIQVAIISDESRQEPAAGYRFVQRALNPFAESGRGSIETLLLASEQFDQFAAARNPLAIILNAHPLSDASANGLLRYLRDGGSVIYFVSGESDKANLLKLQAFASGDLSLPFKMHSQIDRADNLATLTDANFDAPMLKPFKDVRDLGNVHFRRYFATERTPGQGEVLLRFDDRNIALARKSIGLGSLLIANFSPAPDNGDLAKRTIFIPLLHEMVKAMRPQNGGAKTFIVGAPASTTIPMPVRGQELRFTNPDGEKVNAIFEAGKTDAMVIFPVTKQAGFYRVFVGDQLAGSVAVNVDARESNLESLTLKQIEEQSEIARDRLVVLSGSNGASLEHLREGRPIWQYCLLGALGVLAVEEVFAHLWKRRT